MGVSFVLQEHGGDWLYAHGGVDFYLSLTGARGVGGECEVYRNSLIWKCLCSRHYTMASGDVYSYHNNRNNLIWKCLCSRHDTMAYEDVYSYHSYRVLDNLNSAAYRFGASM